LFISPAAKPHQMAVITTVQTEKGLMVYAVDPVTMTTLVSRRVDGLYEVAAVIYEVANGGVPPVGDPFPGVPVGPRGLPEIVQYATRDLWAAFHHANERALRTHGP